MLDRVRAVRRLIIFIVTALQSLAARGGARAHAAKADWLHRWCVILLRRLNVTVEFAGTPPARGLLISNHLSYLDIVIFSSIAPSVFVSKKEVESWPLVGALATSAGSVYVDRGRPSQTHDVKDSMAQVLSEGVVVVLFPEGTSTNGSELLPFRPALFESASATNESIHAAHISYEVPGGDAASDVCWFGDDAFFPHLMNLLRRKHIIARVRYSPEAIPSADRKLASQRSREVVLALKMNQRVESESFTAAHQTASAV